LQQVVAEAGFVTDVDHGASLRSAKK